MNKSLRWKLILAFVLIFLAGAACGFFGAVHMHRGFFAHMAPDSMARHMKERLRVELSLTPDQMQKSQTHHEIQPLLTPEQRIKLEEMEKRHSRLLHRHGFMPPNHPLSPTPGD